MAALTTAVVSARTTSGCTVTFNAAAIDCNVAQLKQLEQLFNRLVLDTGGCESDDLPVVVTVGAQA